MTTIKHQLIAARAIVAKGWTQRFFSADKFYSYDSTTEPKGNYERKCFCIAGAVGEATATSYGSSAVMEELVKYMPAPSMSVGQSVYDWNDEPGRTQAEVLALFDKAISGVGR